MQSTRKLSLLNSSKLAVQRSSTLSFSPAYTSMSLIAIKEGLELHIQSIVNKYRLKFERVIDFNEFGEGGLGFIVRGDLNDVRALFKDDIFNALSFDHYLPQPFENDHKIAFRPRDIPNLVINLSLLQPMSVPTVYNSMNTLFSAYPARANVNVDEGRLIVEYPEKERIADDNIDLKFPSSFSQPF